MACGGPTDPPEKDPDIGPKNVGGPCWFCQFCWFGCPRLYFAKPLGLDSHFKSAHGELYPAFRSKKYLDLNVCSYLVSIVFHHLSDFLEDKYS